VLELDAKMSANPGLATARRTPRSVKPAARTLRRGLPGVEPVRVAIACGGFLSSRFSPFIQEFATYTNFSVSKGVKVSAGSLNI
jgi:hypothetical protein